MSTDLIPMIRATSTQLAKRKSAIVRRGKVSETDILSEEHASMEHVDKKSLSSLKAKIVKERQQQKQQSKPSFYRYSQERAGAK